MVTKRVDAALISPHDQPRFPRQGDWTYQDWLNFPDDGWKYEIIDGVLQMSPPPSVNHQRSSGGLFARMRLYAEDKNLGEVLEAPCGVRLPNQPVPVEPDIFFVKKERIGIIGNQYVEGVPDLVIEILSPSNASYDRETKFKLYQEAGVPEYWLVDYEAKTIEVFNLAQENYTLTGKYTGDDTAASTQLPGFKIVVGILFNF
ncbi:MAG: Uma2 family endonuclease [Anaerolineales bacterium]|nr:Uma2 family endonuclease [Anaerolineales bacterium]